MNDRIRLAEAMGWKRKDRENHYEPQYWLSPKVNSRLFRYTEGSLPDPFTDANDDYAVLEWMRQGEFARQVRFRGELLDANDGMTAGYPNAYVLGDYARAALKVLDNE